MASSNDKDAEIRRNMQKSEAVTACIELINNVLDEYPLFTEEEKSEVTRRVAEEFNGKPPKTNFTPMTYDEARHYWHTHVMSFGKWKNTPLCEVEWNYLEWLNDSEDHRRDLARFMESTFVKNQHYINSK